MLTPGARRPLTAEDADVAPRQHIGLHAVLNRREHRERDVERRLHIVVDAREAPAARRR